MTDMPGRGGAALFSTLFATLVGTLLASLAGCAAPAPPLAMRFIGEQRIAPGTLAGGTPVGGLSAIDFDPASGRWVLFSDDRSERAPARAWLMRLDADALAFHSVTVERTVTLRDRDGKPYPPPRDDRHVDIEAGRVDPLDGSWWYASEGLPSFVRQADGTGRALADLPLPALLRGCGGCAAGAPVNLGIEGLAFAPDGRTLWLAMEAPLWQDGLPAGPARGAMVRITRLERTGRQAAQYAYPLDPVPVAPAPGGLSDNGVAEILAIDDARLLVLERSGSQNADGQFAFHVRLYEAMVDGATDVSASAALAGAFTPMRKRLLLDAGTLPLAQVGNLEGMAWGPALPDGSTSLVLVSDDNFSAAQPTQLLLFAVRGVPAPVRPAK